MKKIFIIFVAIVALSLVNVVNAEEMSLSEKKVIDIDNNLGANLKGKILLQVESNGEAWYFNPINSKAYSLGRPSDAFNVMRQQGVGITNKNLNKIPVAETSLSNLINIDSDNDGYNDKQELQNGYNPYGGGKIAIDKNFANSHKGKIFLQIESRGEAWYVNPVNGLRYYLGSPADAFIVMRNLGLGISNKNLNKIIKKNVEIDPKNKEEDENNTCVGLTKCLKYRNVEIAWELPANAMEHIASINNSKEISSQYVEESIVSTKKALDKYPSGVLNRYLNRIYLLDSLSVDNIMAGGTADIVTRSIFIVPNIQSGDRTSEQIIHHELAHILFINPDNSYWLAVDFKDEFSAVNTSSINYDKKNIVNIKNIHSFSPALAENGYLTYYSTYSVEEDVAQMAANMFKNNSDVLGTDFWELIDNNSKLKEKFKLMVRFYSERDPKFFNEEYFRKISQK